MIGHVIVIGTAAILLRKYCRRKEEREVEARAQEALRREDKKRPESFIKSPYQKDISPDARPHTFDVVNPEGEIYTINTADRSSCYYGPVWSDILSALEDKGAFLTGYVKTRCRSSGNCFAGYTVDINGVEAFMPRRKCGYYYDEKRDAMGKSLAVRPFEFCPAGRKRGNLLVEALSIHRPMSRNRIPAMNKGSEVWGLAVDSGPGRLCLELPWRKFGICDSDRGRLRTGCFYRVRLLAAPTRRKREMLPVSVIGEMKEGR